MPLPRSTIISDPLAIKSFLLGGQIEYDDIWILRSEDLLGLDSALTTYLQRQLRAAVSRTQTANYQFILNNLGCYQRELGGYVRAKRNFLFMLMMYAETPASGPPPMAFSTPTAGGLHTLLAILDFQVRRVVSLTWNPEA